MFGHFAFFMVMKFVKLHFAHILRADYFFLFCNVIPIRRNAHNLSLKI